ncbi:efflux RND transporter periplasmic adaptor subunit [Desertivirga arenae]|uniref:efflux RND transporter periplasmic adaptor subunit n=1 Tax=Desertivirga arenae TaxID=2810309 RepID=UPI001A968909|nr:efflux RND transporter periplasmic adaptor subunit [Pedobacter sp. SYSU D00823]
MKRFTYLIAIAIIAACGKSKDPKTQLAELKKERASLDSKIASLEKEVGGDKKALQVTEVSVVEVQPVIFKSFVEVQGKVDAQENVQVSAEAPGVITAIYVRPGQQVSRGQALVQLDDKVVRQNISQLQTQLELQTSLFNRQKKLWEQKIGTEVQYITAKTQKEAVEKQIAVLRSQLAMYRVKSPISGTVDQMDWKLGQALNPGLPGLTVVNANNLKVKAEVAESYAGRVNTGDEVMVILPDAQDSLSTKVTFASRVIDPASRSFEVNVKLPAKGKYRPNMLAVLKIVDFRSNGALTVPVNAVQKSESGEFVYVAEGGKAKRVIITTDKVSEGQALVASGLKAGDKVITLGFQNLNEGDPVKI